MQVINLTGSHVVTSPEVEMLLKVSSSHCWHKLEVFLFLLTRKSATMGLYSLHTYKFLHLTSGF